MDGGRLGKKRNKDDVDYFPLHVYCYSLTGTSVERAAGNYSKYCVLTGITRSGYGKAVHKNGVVSASGSGIGPRHKE